MKKKNKIKIRDLFFKVLEKNNFNINDWVLVDNSRINDLSEKQKINLKTEIINCNFLNNKLFDIFHYGQKNEKMNFYYLGSKYSFLEKICDNSGYRHIISGKKYQNAVSHHTENIGQKTYYPRIVSTSVAMLPEIFLIRVIKVSSNLFIKINKNNKIIFIEN